ncbi:hypothetical protein AWW67_02540 [Roseivirga seohaensis]|uniref:Imidazole glycerol phosphate synthase subunit HisH n=1 Tax=Roseivirga seohaensis TaxID=1914963 RepID=A0A150XZ48_9BACT|nr:imidazole glycerol phosphate synthase subunit HisH [Roseivirga seohaensis]KYG84013.1 hypothetical protein AWW67_02540 [Roseivirga seohaensis]
MIAIVDYGMGNLGSISNMLKVLNLKSIVTNDRKIIRDSDHIILPGVGSFDKGMSKLNQSGLSELLKELAQNKEIPITGICLGMQLMTKGSEEGNLPGLGLVNATTKHFSKLSYNFQQRIPHMGWNQVELAKRDNYICKGLPEPLKFYFVHSFYVQCELTTDVLMSTYYSDKFTSAFHTSNITGFQFHPEKSHKYGLSLFKNLMLSDHAKY